MRGALFAAGIAACLVGCTVMPREEPAASYVVAGDYRAVADCSFLAISKNWNTARHLALESQGMVRVYYAEGGVHGWDVDFKPAGGGTLVEIKTIDFGRARILNVIRPMVEACAST